MTTLSPFLSNKKNLLEVVTSYPQGDLGLYLACKYVSARFRQAQTGLTQDMAMQQSASIWRCVCPLQRLVMKDPCRSACHPCAHGFRCSSLWSLGWHSASVQGSLRQRGRAEAERGLELVQPGSRGCPFGSYLLRAPRLGNPVNWDTAYITWPFEDISGKSQIAFVLFYSFILSIYPLTVLTVYNAQHSL